MPDGSASVCVFWRVSKIAGPRRTRCSSEEGRNPRSEQGFYRGSFTTNYHQIYIHSSPAIDRQNAGIFSLKTPQSLWVPMRKVLRRFRRTPHLWSYFQGKNKEPQLDCNLNPWIDLITLGLSNTTMPMACRFDARLGTEDRYEWVNGTITRVFQYHYLPNPRQLHAQFAGHEFQLARGQFPVGAPPLPYEMLVEISPHAGKPDSIPGTARESLPSYDVKTKGVSIHPRIALQIRCGLPRGCRYRFWGLPFEVSKQN